MAEKITLENRAIIKLADGLRSLDGVSNETTKIERYDFDENLGWDIARVRHSVEQAETVYQKAKASIAARLGVVDKMRLTETNAASIAQFIEANELLLDKTQELTGILKLSRKKLRDAGVKIPGIFVSLMPILNDL